MTTESEDILERYKRVYEVKDNRGRVIKMKRLRLSEQSRVIEFTETPLNRFNFSVVASVTVIDGTVMIFPKNLTDIHLALDQLDQEGFAAAADKYLEINGLKQDVNNEDESGRTA